MQRLLVAAIAVLLGAPTVARAGALKEVVSGIHAATGHGAPAPPDKGDVSEPRDPPPEHRERSDPSTDVEVGGERTALSCWSCGGWTSPGGTPAPPPPRAFLEGYLGAQSVHDSNGSISGEIRLADTRFGLDAHLTAFWERPDPGSKLLTRLDLWGVALQVRLLGDDEGAVWLEGGPGGLRTVPDITLFGAVAGGRLDKTLTGTMGLTAILRGYFLDDGVRAGEALVAFRISVLRVSYRIVDFNVGPPLRGPEIGLEFRL